jgi:hypothetical protein
MNNTNHSENMDSQVRKTQLDLGQAIQKVSSWASSL